MTASNRPDAELRKQLRDIAAGAAPELLDRARRRATARAEQLIEDALVEELLHAVAEARRSEAPMAQPTRPVRPESAPDAGDPDGSEAWWTYCIMWEADARTESLELQGVEPGTSVEVIRDGELAALISPVPLPDYGDEALRRHLEDLAWVERTARRHEDVLEAALGEATIVPLRLCTLYRSRDGVRRLLREHRSALEEGLGRVDGCLEWAVKVFSDPRAPESAATGPDSADHETGEPRGAAYLQRRQQERALAEKAGEVRARCVEVVHERVEGLARASTVNPPQRPEIHGRGLQMLLNGAYLIARDRTPQLREAVRALQEEWCSLGFTIELTGPWPPYNFVSGAAGVMS
jgi:antitoxin (DNA-binding transcriptional repressor) of toxin-antitoxin stability system